MEILDASALLAFLKQEHGYKVVQTLFRQGVKSKNSLFIHQINYIEVAKKMFYFFGEAVTKDTLANLQQPFFGISNYMDEDLALFAIQIRAIKNISLADAIGLAFTKVMDGRFWTADKALKDVAKAMNIRLELIQ